MSFFTINENEWVIVHDSSKNDVEKICLEVEISNNQKISVIFFLRLEIFEIVAVDFSANRNQIVEIIKTESETIEKNETKPNLKSIANSIAEKVRILENFSNFDQFPIRCLIFKGGWACSSRAGARIRTRIQNFNLLLYQDAFEIINEILQEDQEKIQNALENVAKSFTKITVDSASKTANEMENLFPQYNWDCIVMTQDENEQALESYPQILPKIEAQGNNHEKFVIWPLKKYD